MLTAGSKFAGFGGDAQGIEAIPDVQLVVAANHAASAVATHELNFPNAEHRQGDITKMEFSDWPRVDIDWSSPACPPWTNARGKRMDFDKSTEEMLFQPDETAEQRAARIELNKRRALMEEVPRHLRAMAERGEPVLAGVVENVIQCRKWHDWDRWLKEIRAAAPGGYHVHVIALNAMHAQPRVSLWVPQSRPRLFVAYSLKSLGRVPDWDKWLRPYAHCPTCDEDVQALQVWKKPGMDMGVYGAQYEYRCPRVSCRNRVIQPPVLGADVALDLTLDPGLKIGERPLREYFADKEKTQSLGWHPIAPRTADRIQNGIGRIAGRRMLVTTVGRDGHPARELTAAFGTQTTRRELAVVEIPQWITMMRGGGSIGSGHRELSEPLDTFSAQGYHHALIHPPANFVMSYYGNGSVYEMADPIGTFTTRDRFAVLAGDTETLNRFDISEFRLRMVQNPEIRRGMGFIDGFKIPKMLGTKRFTDKMITTGYGNAVPPACSEVIVPALVEAITGSELERAA